MNVPTPGSARQVLARKKHRLRPAGGDARRPSPGRPAPAERAEEEARALREGRGGPFPRAGGGVSIAAEPAPFAGPLTVKKKKREGEKKSPDENS